MAVLLERIPDGLEEVVLQFATEETIGAALIRWFCHGPFSHVDFVMPSGNLLGARFRGGVLIRHPGYANFSKTLRMRVRTRSAPDVYRWAQRQLDKPYDWRAILAFGAGRNWRDVNAWFCSELVAAAFDCTPARLVGYTPANRVTPNDLLISPRLEVMEWSSTR